MELLVKTLSVIILLFLIDIGISNGGTTVLSLWPLDSVIEGHLGFIVILISVLSFFIGGLFMYLTGVHKYRKILRESEKRIKELEAELKEEKSQRIERVEE